VSADEKEAGIRECLNYGHTLGHAIENVAGYGVIPHGLAVAEGMRFAVRLGVEVVGASREFVARQDAILDALGLPALASAWPAEKLLTAMRLDKKARSGSVRFVLAASPGSWSCTAVEDQVIREHLNAWAGSKGSD
jgi:3-dehydroquinate synthase